MAEDLLGALITALRFCWDESIGYSQTTRYHNPNMDCSSFVYYALEANGFNVGQTPFSTVNEGSVLRNAGFTEYIWNQNLFTPQHGDIFLYDEGGGDDGHTFFYAENVYGYVNGYNGWQYCNAQKGMIPQAKIEASGKHNHPEDGDQDNGLGAHTEVWVHSYNVLADPDYTWYVYRWGGDPPGPIPPGPFPPGTFPTWLIKRLYERNNMFNNGD